MLRKRGFEIEQTDLCYWNLGTYNPLLENLQGTNLRVNSDCVLFFNMQERIAWPKHPAKMFRNILKISIPLSDMVSGPLREDDGQTMKNHCISSHQSLIAAWTPIKLRE